VIFQALFFLNIIRYKWTEGYNKEVIKMKLSDFRATEIIASDNCNCSLSKHAGKRMLFNEVQSLIANSFFQSNCTCTFKHYADRRTNIDRRKFDENISSFSKQMRKIPYGRRAIDIHNRARDQFVNERLQA